MERDVLEHIRQSHIQAEHEARFMKAALGAGDRAAFNASLREYLFVRFQINSEIAGNEQNIEELARKSLVLQKGERAVRENDRAINCQSSSTAEEKSLLFILVVRRSLGLELAPAQLARIETLPQLADALWNARESRASSRGASSV